MSPMLSVVIPLYNKERYILRALESVSRQEHANFECIVVDDASSDRSPELVRAWRDPRVRLVCQRENMGASAARNSGVAAARGSVVAFLDGDDEWAPGFLSTIERLRSAYPGCGAYATAYEIAEPGGYSVKPRYWAIPPAPWEGIIPNYAKTALGASPVSSSTVAVERDALQAAGLFPTESRHCEDVDTWFRVALRYPIAFTTRVCAVYHRDAEGRKCLRVEGYKDSRLITTLTDLLDSGALPAGFSVEDLVEYRNKLLIQCARACVTTNDRWKARRQLIQASSTKVFRRDWITWYFLSFVPFAWVHAIRRMKRAVTTRRQPRLR